MGAAVAGNNVVGTVVPLALTRDEGALVGVLGLFEGTCFSTFADGA
jgi:hypothetical protein